ncbi:ABC transporter substrate-binding protein [Desulfovibrio sp. JC010]|uniref:ABC transporter substrate-binding protein n=1 Tax=Desulfovibrio sp. JC010 TaxID=2593641 RepID=UPI0013D0FA73|nr:ABC transporter substrate-binding protein [Desulfovibrio sp. JC010]
MRKSVLTAGVLFIFFAVAVYLFMPFDADEKVHKIGVLQFTKNNLSTFEGFKDGLKELGYPEGDKVVYFFDGPAPSKNDLVGYMQKLLDRKPDLIFASPTPAAIVAKKMTAGTGIPVVFAPVNDPVSAGIVKDVRAPAGNITGVRLSASDGRRLLSLKDVVPSVNNVFVPYSPGDKSAAASLRMLEDAAPKVGVILTKKPFYKETNILVDKSYVPDGVDAILLPREGLVMSRIRDFVTLCLERKLPLSTPRYKQVELGALTGYGFNGYKIGRQSARMAHMLLSGAPVSSLPVETSEDYLFINLKTAGKIGVDISDEILRQAQEIVR